MRQYHADKVTGWQKEVVTKLLEEKRHEDLLEYLRTTQDDAEVYWTTIGGIVRNDLTILGQLNWRHNKRSLRKLKEVAEFVCSEDGQMFFSNAGYKRFEVDTFKAWAEYILSDFAGPAARVAELEKRVKDLNRKMVKYDSVVESNRKLRSTIKTLKNTIGNSYKERPMARELRKLGWKLTPPSLKDSLE